MCRQAEIPGRRLPAQYAAELENGSGGNSRLRCDPGRAQRRRSTEAQSGKLRFYQSYFNSIVALLSLNVMGTSSSHSLPCWRRTQSAADTIFNVHRPSILNVPLPASSIFAARTARNHASEFWPSDTYVSLR